MKTKQINNKDYILCPWRRKWVRLTPEEWVRQQFLARMVRDYHYPEALIGVEIAIRVGEVNKRIDAIVMDDNFRPVILMEFKREGVALTQKVLDQASVYNRAMQVPMLILSNGPETRVVRVMENSYEYLESIPEWKQL